MTLIYTYDNGEVLVVEIIRLNDVIAALFGQQKIILTPPSEKTKKL